jgi:hypothetical protein
VRKLANIHLFVCHSPDPIMDIQDCVALYPFNNSPTRGVDDIAPKAGDSPALDDSLTFSDSDVSIYSATEPDGLTIIDDLDFIDSILRGVRRTRLGQDLRADSAVAQQQQPLPLVDNRESLTATQPTPPLSQHESSLAASTNKNDASGDVSEHGAVHATSIATVPPSKPKRPRGRSRPRRQCINGGANPTIPATSKQPPLQATDSVARASRSTTSRSSSNSRSSTTSRSLSESRSSSSKSSHMGISVLHQQVAVDEVVDDDYSDNSPALDGADNDSFEDGFDGSVVQASAPVLAPALTVKINAAIAQAIERARGPPRRGRPPKKSGKGYCPHRGKQEVYVDFGGKSTYITMAANTRLASMAAEIAKAILEAHSTIELHDLQTLTKQAMFNLEV